MLLDYELQKQKLEIALHLRTCWDGIYEPIWKGCWGRCSLGGVEVSWWPGLTIHFSASSHFEGVGRGLMPPWRGPDRNLCWKGMPLLNWSVKFAGLNDPIIPLSNPGLPWPMWLPTGLPSWDCQPEKKRSGVPGFSKGFVTSCWGLWTVEVTLFSSIRLFCRGVSWDETPPWVFIRELSDPVKYSVEEMDMKSCPKASPFDVVFWWDLLLCCIWCLSWSNALSL